MKPFNENYVGKSFRYEIGRKRFDGKFNVWTLVEIAEHHTEWVIVNVARSWPAAKAWIDDKEAFEAKAA